MSPTALATLGSKLTADPGVFGRSISITDAKLILPGGGEVAAPVLLLNRDLIAGISVTEERRSREDSLQRTA